MSGRGEVAVDRGLAVVMVSGLYAANLAGRLLASRVAPGTTTERVLAAALIVGLIGLPILLAARPSYCSLLPSPATTAREPPCCTWSGWDRFGSRSWPRRKA
ncbi:MAG: hypothetical protein ACR2OB_14965 [Solirubrobacteraceae bacterium]